MTTGHKSYARSTEHGVRVRRHGLWTVFSVRRHGLWIVFSVRRHGQWIVVYVLAVFSLCSPE